MAGNPNRHSTYSNSSAPPSRHAPQSSQVSTTTLLNALHTSYNLSQPYSLEPSTSLVVNTWRHLSSTVPGGRHGGTVDLELAKRAWEHARRRAEDGCIVLSSAHESTPSLLAPFVSALPLAVPSTFYTALQVLHPFLHCSTPQNPSMPRHSALAATFTLNMQGELTAASLGLSTSGIDTRKGLLQVPSQAGYRAFDVFYYLLNAAATPGEREFLGLKTAPSYTLLKKSETYSPPSYLPTADDAAAAEDFRASLKAIGIKGNVQRNLLATLAGLLKLGDTLDYLVNEDVVEEVCEEVAGLLDLDPEVLARRCNPSEREVLIAGLYEALVDWVIRRANEAIHGEMKHVRAGDSSSDSDSVREDLVTPPSSADDGDSVSITVLEIPDQDLGKAVALRTVFDDTVGINREMKDDGVTVERAGHSVLKELEAAVATCEADLGIPNGPSAREKEHERDRRQGVLEKVGHETEANAFLHDLLFPVSGQGIGLDAGRFHLPGVLASNRIWFHLCLHPTDSSPASLASQATSAWSAGSVSRQLRAWRLPEWANRRNKYLDFTADFDYKEFTDRYSRLGCQDGRDGVESWIMERGWSNGDIVMGHERIWMRENAWAEVEGMLDLKPIEEVPFHTQSYTVQSPGLGSGFFGPSPDENPFASRDNLLQRNQSSATVPKSAMGGRATAMTMRTASGGDYGLGTKGDTNLGGVTYLGDDPELGDPQKVVEEKVTRSRQIWIAIVWGLTCFIPSFLLRTVGRMKRPDVRFAWREKLVLFFMIGLLNGFILFYIIGFGRILCPNYDKAWNVREVGYHQGESDYWVGFRGGVYDLTKFWRLQHSDSAIKTTPQNMMPLAGLILDNYIVPPLDIACPGFGINGDTMQLQFNQSRMPEFPQAVHTIGRNQPEPDSALRDTNWYRDKFLPRMREYRKGDLVWKTSQVRDEGQNQQHMWVQINDRIYDLTDYFHTLEVMNNYPGYDWLDPELTDIIQQNPGQDITEQVYSSLNFTARTNNMNCLNNLFYVGKTDFRDTARCQVNNYLLLAFTIILCAVILVKFLAALQLGSKRRPAAQDKFVICQVPAYTEGEDHLRKGLDSLTALAYDNKRKLICVICDGMIVGGGNDRPTPKIVLDILGVDPKIDPPALPFKSVGQGNEQLNYGKVYSGLYEYEGNVVPYIVVVKVGKESEQTQSKPGNRGKRDSQIMLLSFLNRVHHRSPMSPLELEIFHQINNIIGVDPELYEYLFMVDADTMIAEDSLNRLVAACANDAKIAGICGETSLENEERSWWTMIQVYEYYISHHLAKAFESLFGSVTCLPGCFCMYRLRTADKGKPLIISEKVITEYADIYVDTLHKKNLLSLGEDRFLTTLMTKHFPSMSYKFVPSAYAQTAAPEEWSVLLSQRRRWINSTVHNLAELVWLKDMCGFCCFSMRFVVFIDLFGTIILPATCGYIAYLIYTVSSGKGSIPIVSIIMIAAVYGLQAIIFIIKRQWQHVGWMIIYILAFPIYSFILPIYSFWKQDDFSWGNTRIVLEEKGGKQVVAMQDEGFDPRSIPMQRWDDYALANNLPGRRGLAQTTEKAGYEANEYEMDDMHSVYSSVKPASTVFTGFHQQPNQYAYSAAPAYMPPQSPVPMGPQQYRQSSYSIDQGRLMSMGNMSEQYAPHPAGTGPAFNQLQPQPLVPYNRAGTQSSDNLLVNNLNNGGTTSSSPLRSSSKFNLAPAVASAAAAGTTNAPPSRPVSSQLNLQAGSSAQQGPSDSAITEAIQTCLREVDLDTVTKKQVKALVEQRLQCQLVGERRAWADQRIDFELAQM